MAGAVTIRDVATAANVSVATVSRALNGQTNVTDEVRRRVVEAARQLQYSPHAAARSLSSRRTRTLGVVLPDLYGEFFSELMRGIDQVAREHDMHLLVSSYHGHHDEQGSAMRSMRGRVDGLLVMSPYAASPLASDEVAPGLPVVLINSQHAGENYLSLGVDNYEGARTMMAHLIDSGHRRIAFIAGPEDNFDAYQRLRGYRDAMAELGAKEWVLPGAFDEASGHSAGRALLEAGARPDAVFAANDMMALGCLFAFSEAGVRVPQDVAIAGFDDIPLAGFVHPRLTTMRVDISGLGAAAARMLLGRLARQEASPAPAPLVPELVIRESSRGPRHAESS